MVRVTVSPSPQTVNERQGDTPLPNAARATSTTRRYSRVPYASIVVGLVALVALVLGYAFLLAEPPSPSRWNAARLSHVLTSLLRTMATTLTVTCTMLLSLFVAAPMVYFVVNESTRK
jgi:hypothetical protein